MKTETLKGFGLDDEQIKQVMAEHGDDLNALKQERDAAEQERDSYKSQFDDINTQLADAQKSVRKGSEYQDQLKELQTKFDESKANAEQQLQETKKSYEISNALREAGAKNEKAVMALIDTDSITFNNNGKLTGLSDQLDSVKKDNDFLFVAENDDGKTPTITPTAPVVNHDISAIKQFKNAGNRFTAYKSFKVDKIAYVNGMWQAINYDLAGGKDANWTTNGIPLAMLDNVTRGNYQATRVGDQVKFMSGYDHGTIDQYDNNSNGAGIVEGRYGVIWYNADALLAK